MKRLLLALMMTASAQAATTIEYGVHVNHLVQGEFNEDNKFIAAQYIDDGLGFGVQVSTFENSYYVRSHSLGFVLRMYDGEYLSFDIGIGLLTGYTEYQTAFHIKDELSLYAAPSVSLKIPVSDSVKALSTLRLLGDAYVVSVGLEL